MRINRAICEEAYRVYQELDRLNEILKCVKNSEEPINFAIEGFPSLGNRNSITCRSGPQIITRSIQKEINFLNGILENSGFEYETEKETENGNTRSD